MAHYLALTCEALARSIYATAAQTDHTITVQLYRQGLHNRPKNLRAEIRMCNQGNLISTNSPSASRTCVTDNVAVQSVILFHRHRGTISYSSRTMTKTSGDRYTATLEGTLLVSPGVDYYIQASDGVNMVRSGRPELPHTIAVDDRPTVTNITPNQGSAAGGTVVTIVGSNFKTGASVTFGSALAGATPIT